MGNAQNATGVKSKEITECAICLKPFTDPRMLPCIHTFCLECLNKTRNFAKKNPGEMLPCPLCRKDFTIPKEGMAAIQKNSFMSNLLEVKKTLGKTSRNLCDVCGSKRKGEIEKDLPEATHRCLECQESFCESCLSVHSALKMAKSHTVVKIGNESEEDLIKRLPATNCKVHKEKPLDYYCTQCRKVVCVSCFVENHSSHGCKDVITMEAKFREIIEKNALKLSEYSQEVNASKKLAVQRKVDFLSNISEVEKLILKRNKELKDMIERETKSLLKELSFTKEEHLKELHTEIEEIERSCVALQNLEIYCSELISKGSASDICGSVDEILKRLDEIDEEHEAAACRWPNKTLEVSFSSIDTPQNLVGQIKKDEYSTCAALIGINDGPIITSDVFKVDLHNSGNEISYMDPLPTTAMPIESSAAVYRNSVFVVGTGKELNEIWKHDWTSGWIQCASLVEGRSRHSVAFVDEVLYICGGNSMRPNKVLDSVEECNINTNRCTTVGKLVFGVQEASNCVSFKNSLYTFGGNDENDEYINHVQKYDTKQNTCTLLSKPMPFPCRLMRAALWQTSVILLGDENCFIFHLETETWEERNQYKTEVDYFGLVLEDSRIFVIGGGKYISEANGKADWKCRDDVRYVPVMNIILNKPAEWKVLVRLPKPCMVHSHAKIKKRFKLN